MTGFTPEEIRALLTDGELLALVKDSVEQAEERAERAKKEPGLQPERGLIYDELLEMSLALRTRLEKGDRKEALFGLVSNMIQFAVGPNPWSLSRPGTQERTKRFAAVAGELLKRNPSLLNGTTPAERLVSFGRLVKHAEGMWRSSVLLYRAGSYAHGCFLAITCLEEVGKSVPARMMVKIESVHGPVEERPVPAGDDRKGNPLYRHQDKHFLAAASGALFNPRLEAILGTPKLELVLSEMESGKLGKLREQCLYVDVTDRGVIWPEEQITAEIARKWILVAGEILAEVLGYPEAEQERLLVAVQDFEAAVGAVLTK